MNGWKNRSTWLIKIWFEPEAQDLDWIQDTLETRVNQLADSTDVFDKFLADHINLAEIDWDELREALTDDEDELDDTEDDMDGDFDSAMASAGFGTDEDYEF